MKRVIEYEGKRLTDNGDVPEWYCEVVGNDILDDAIPDAKTGRVRRPGVMYLGILTAMLLATLGSPEDFGEAEKAKAVKEAKESFSTKDIFNPTAISICNSIVSGEDPKKAGAEIAEEPKEDPASSSTPSSSPSSSASQSAGSESYPSGT